MEMLIKNQLDKIPKIEDYDDNGYILQFCREMMEKNLEYNLNIELFNEDKPNKWKEMVKKI